MNHHQLPLCEYLYKNCDEFIFVSVDDIPDAMLKFGYTNLSQLPYILNYNDENKSRIEKFLIEADIAIFGASSDVFLHKRMKFNKLSFIFSERLWKLGAYRRFIPPIRKKVDDRFTQYKDQNLYVLCASAFLPYDLSLIGFPVDKCFKWGYFTEVSNTDVSDVIQNKPDIFTLCWVGRFIPLKRGEDLIRAAAILKKRGYKFKIKFIGSGELLPKYEKMITDKSLCDYINIKENMPQEKVRLEMCSSHALVFSSDFNEGWGAVVNEAMDSACVPIVSHAVGSSPFLIENKKNGLIYKMGNIKDLVDKISLLIDNLDVCKSYMNESAKTVKNLYNGDIAGYRLIETSNNILNNKYSIYNNGPMSKVKILKNDWIKNYE